MTEATGAGASVQPENARRNERVARQIEQFKRKCGEHGEEALNFAYHAALPVALNPEFLHLLRINFFVDIDDPLPYEVEFEFLLSPLCRQIDEGLYEVEQDVRLVLLEGLAREFGQERMQEVAMLLWHYARQQEPWSAQIGLERAQQLTILSTLDVDNAKQWLAKSKSLDPLNIASQQEWFIAMQAELSVFSQIEEKLIDWKNENSKSNRLRGKINRVLILEMAHCQNSKLHQNVVNLETAMSQVMDLKDCRVFTHSMTQFEELLVFVNMYQPQVLHLHSAENDKGLNSQDSTGKVQLLPEQSLEAVFKLFSKTLQCVFLNSRYSTAQADAIARHIQYVLAWDVDTSSKEYIYFILQFYNALSEMSDIRLSYEYAFKKLEMRYSLKAKIPVLIGSLGRFLNSPSELI